MNRAPSADHDAGDHRGDVRRAGLRMQLRRQPRQQAVTRHGVEDARLSVLEHQQHRRHGHDRAGRHDPAGGRQAGQFERMRQRVARPQLLVRHQSRRDEADDDVDQRADRQPAQDADRQVALRVLRFFARGRDRVEADVREEHDRRALMDAAKSVRREGHVVLRVDVHAPHDHEQRQHQQLHHDHDVVGACALLHAVQQQPW